MSVEVKVNSFPESVEDGTLMAWHKREGDVVASGEKVADIETDKIVIELPAPAGGVLRGLTKRVGEVVRANEVIATIEAGAVAPAAPSADREEAPAAVPAMASPPPAPAPAPEAAKAPEATPAPAPQAESAQASDEAFEASASRLSPAARKLALEHGIDPSHLIGTGRGERVTKADVVRHIEAMVSASPPIPTIPIREPATEADRKAALAGIAPASAPPPAPMPTSAAPTAPGDRPERRVPMTRLRARVAQRLVEAQRTAAILTTFNEVNLQAVSDLRQRYRDEFEKAHGVKLGFMSFFVKATVEALKTWPAVNAAMDGADILYHDYFDIGIAVSSPRGLVVPVLRDADQLSFADIEKAIRDFGQRAKDSQLTMEELTGGTFTITNGGVFGSMLSTPILNPPQSGILGMHAIQERPVAENGQVVIRPMMYIALSYDHRLIDGREAVSFLVTIKKLLEDPSRLLFNL